MAKYIGNAFSLNMVSREDLLLVRFNPLTLEEARVKALGATSVVGHADTANVIGKELKMEVAFNRVTLTLEAGDELIVAQYKGPRLEEGAKELPADATIEWVSVLV